MDHKLVSFFAFTRRLAVMLAATALSAVSQATTMNNAGTSLEANLSAGQQPGSPAWWGGTNVFENYGPLTVAEWNGGNTPSWRAASVLQWTLNGFVNSGDTMGTVNSASFTIMGKQAGGNTYRVYRLQAPIDGATTWNTKPLLDASAFVEFTMAADYALQTVDVSSLLLKNGTLHTFGIAVLLHNGSGGDNFWSSAYGTTWPALGNQNRLNADYSVITPVITNAGTSMEANLSAGSSNGSPDSPAWWGGTNVFESYGPLTATEWNGGDTPSWRAASILQWNLNGFTNVGDSIGTVNGATIQVMPKGANGNVYRLYRVAVSIDESTTWNTKPQLDTSAYVSFTAGPDNTWQSVDVSSLLANNGTLTTFGVAVLNEVYQESSTGENFWSKSYGSSWPVLGNQNRLVAAYTVQNATVASAATSIEANLSAGTADGDPNSPEWWYGTDFFASYGPVTAADWNGGASTFNYRAGAILQWNLSGFISPDDVMGTVNSASFTIMGKQAAGNIYKVYRLKAPITGSTTWNTKPELDTSAFVSFTMAADYSLQTIDVSSLLAGNGSLTTFGVAVLVDSIGQSGDSNFWSTAYNQWPAFTSHNKLSANYSVYHPTITELLWNNSAGNGIWSASAVNWTPGYAWFQGVDAVFGSTGARTVNVDGSLTVRNITFNADGYTITDTGTSGTITLNGSSISVGTGFFASISDSLAGSNGLTKEGEGTLILSASNSYTGTTTVNKGTLRLTTAYLSDTSKVSIATGAALNLTHGTVDDVETLKFNNVVQKAGIYNSANSGGFITGNGSIRVPLSEVRSNAYRDAAAGGQIHVRGRICAIDTTQRAQMQPRLQVVSAQGVVVLDVLEAGASLTEASWDFDASPLAPGDYSLRITVGSSAGHLVSVERPFQRLAQPIERKVTFDKMGRTLVNGQRFFPLGTYATSMSSADLATYQNSPFNCIMPYASMDGSVVDQTARLDACHAAGIKVIFSVKDTFEGLTYAPTAEAGRAALQAAVAAHKDHPALLAWYIADEEPITNLDELRLHYQLVRDADPNHPCWEVFWQSDLVERSESYDVLGTDPYPVVTHSDSDIYQSHRINYPLKMARLTADASRPGPVWMVPQAHNLACYDVPGVPPTRDEMRSMAWQCIAGGANGLVFYSYFDLQRDPAATFTERWNDLKAVGQEIKNLESMLLADPAPTGMVSGPINDEVGWRAYQLDGDICLVAVNATRTTSSASFTLGQAMYPSVLLGRDLDGGSTANLTLDLQPLEVRIIRLSTSETITQSITSAASSIEANLAAGTASGDPNSPEWWYGTDFFASYGRITAADWNGGGNAFNSRAGAILQWNLSGFISPDDVMGTVNSASFTIMGKQAAGNIYKVYRLKAPITGSTTWNTKPELDTSAFVSFTMAADYSLQTIDVSSLLARNGSLTTFGVAILVDSISEAGDSNFWSSAYNIYPAYTSQNKLSASYTIGAAGTASYFSWAATNAGGQTAEFDYDNDGVSNGIEYFMNAAAGFTANPSLVGNTVTWPNGGNISSSAYGTGFVVQISTDLMNWTDVPGTDPNLANISGSVAYTLSDAGKKFARLKVTPMN